MKKITLLIFCLVSINLVHGQIKNKFIGRWQAESATLSSMNLDTYNFFADGRFTFEPNSYNGLNRVISINGRYRIKGNKLFLTPESTKEVIGGFPIRSELTTLSDTWEIVQGKIKVIPCKKIEQTVLIQLYSKNIINLDNRKFYKIVL